MTLIFGSVGGEAWRAAEAGDVFAGAVVDADARGPALRWRPSQGGMLSPVLHEPLAPGEDRVRGRRLMLSPVLHEPLAPETVVWTRPPPLGKAGRLLFGSLAA